MIASYEKPFRAAEPAESRRRAILLAERAGRATALLQSLDRPALSRPKARSTSKSLFFLWREADKLI